ncbi:glycine zipper domain-containing protein [Sodalis-like endosymbiont of Proechinophthirus fluctus]
MDDYVQENPWHGVGIGASVGLVVISPLITTAGLSAVLG